MLLQTAPLEKWPADAREALFVPHSPTSTKMLKRADRFFFSKMATGAMPFDTPLCLKQACVLRLMQTRLRDKSAVEDVLNTVARFDRHPESMIYYDVLLGENRYANGGVPKLAQAPRSYKKRNQRQRNSYEEYIYHCVQCKSPVPKDSMSFFLQTEELSARDYFEGPCYKKIKTQ